MSATINVELWFAPEPHEYPESLQKTWLGWLSQPEKHRYGRFARPQDKNRFLHARALCRSVLGRHLGLAPQDIGFGQGVYGKPALETTNKLVQFNLSHTPGMAVLALGHGCDLGVDVEDINRDLALIELARRYFSPDEIRDIESLQGPMQRERFFHVWTLKEAWLKAKGLGLRVPLDRFSFSEREDKSAVLHCDAILKEEPLHWAFYEQNVGSFRVALACHNPGECTLRVQVRQASLL